MSNFTCFIYAILLTLLFPYAAELRPSDFHTLATNAQSLITVPVAALADVFPHGPGHGLTPSVRNSGRASRLIRPHRRNTVRALPRVDGVLADLQAGRILAVLLAD